MLQVPYVQSPAKNGCALACYLMIAQTFFPDTSLDDVKQIVRWKDGYAPWPFPFWRWLIEKGIAVTDYDSLPYEVWASEGFDNFSCPLSPAVSNHFRQITFDPSSYEEDLKWLFHRTEAFTYRAKVPQLSDLQEALANGELCEAVVNSCLLNQTQGFSLHRVVVLGMDSDHVTFHDPVRPEWEPRPNRTEPIDLFLKASLSQPDGAELCCYRMSQT